jgi:hypothetical protein
LSKRSNVFSKELEKTESVYFRNILILQKKAVLYLVDKAKSYDEEKLRVAKLMDITPYF